MTLLFSESFNEHIKHLRRETQRLTTQSHGVNLKPQNYEIFKRKVTFLGRITSKDGNQKGSKATHAVMTFKDLKPKTVGGVSQAVGLLGVYRHHIKNFARIAKPIYDLLNKGPILKKGNTKTHKKSFSKSNGQ